MSAGGVVLMAVFRPDAILLRRQVESLRGQTLADWECRVGIDGFDPMTNAMLREIIGNDGRFTVTEYAENVGHYRNFERLTRDAPHTAAWIAYCDQDDFWYPQKLERLVSRLQRDPNAFAVEAAARVVTDQGGVLGVTCRKQESFPQIFLKNEVTGSFTIFRPDVLDLAFPFPASTKAAVHDHWLGVCAAALGEVVVLSEPLQDYVQHEANAIGEATRSTLRSHLKTARRVGGLAAYLRGISREQWGWRVSMARTLRPRLQSRGARDIDMLRSVERGQLTPLLMRQLGVEVAMRRVQPRTALTTAAAASWWHRTTRWED